MGSLNEIGKRIKEIRKNAGLTQQEAAEKLGIHVNYYARIERGEVKPNTKFLEKLAKIFKVNLEINLG